MHKNFNYMLSATKKKKKKLFFNATTSSILPLACTGKVMVYAIMMSMSVMLKKKYIKNILINV